MFLKFTKAFGQPGCVALYAVFSALAVKITVIPLILLLVMHFTEYLIIGHKVAKENGLGIAEGFLKCMSFGFTWWLPIKKESKNTSEDKAN